MFFRQNADRSSQGYRHTPDLPYPRPSPFSRLLAAGLMCGVVAAGSAQPRLAELDSGGQNGGQNGGLGGDLSGDPVSRYIYLLDRTDTMASAIRGTGNSRCADARTAALADLRQLFTLEADTRVAVWTFNGSATTALTDGFTNSLPDALLAVASLSPDGCGNPSPLAEALCSATDDLLAEVGETAGSLAIVLSSDGEESNSVGPCAGPPSVSAAPPYTQASWQFQVLQSLLNGQVILSIRLWTGAATDAKGSPTAASFFAELAQLTGGVYSESPDSGNAVPLSIFSLFEDGFEAAESRGEPNSFVLNVGITGTGQGQISSTPAGLDCEPDCALLVEQGRQITLQATPDSQSAFTGWSGACSGMSACEVTMDQNQSVTAIFDLREVVVTIQASTTATNAGEAVDISWSVENFIENLTVCTATSGPAEWVSDVNASPAGGNGSYRLGNTATFSLQCDQSTDSVTVSVTAFAGLDGFPPPPAFCGELPPGRALPFNIFKDFASNPPDGQPKVNFSQVWGNFPGSNEATILIPDNQYVSLPFYANQEPGKIWRLTWVGGPTNGDATSVSISRCPGDFAAVGYSDPRCSATAGSEGASILTIIGSGNACPLIGGPSEVYYLNIRHTFSNGDDACREATGSCGFLGAPRRLN